MRKILLVISDLDYGGTARQMTLLATGLPPDQFEVYPCILGTNGPLARTLNAAGLNPEFLGWTRFFDIQPFWRLQQRVRMFRPDVIHAWGWPALRTVGLLRAWERGHGKNQEPPVVLASVSLPLSRHSSELSRLDQWLLRNSCLVPDSQSGADFCRRLGLAQNRIHLVPPGVELNNDNQDYHNGQGAGHSMAKDLGLPETTRFLACVGPLKADKELRSAVWALDMLNCLYEDLHLLIIGTGPERFRLEQFARAIQAGDRVHFLGNQADLQGLLAQSRVVLVPSQKSSSGQNVALEAMALGLPVVASRLPALAEIVIDGETGFLVPPGDKAALARRTRNLLDNPALAHRLGKAGRRRAEDYFAASTMAKRFADLYTTLGQSHEVTTNLPSQRVS